MTAAIPVPPEPVDPALFREGMSRVAGAVHLVTTLGPGGRAGFTATAVTPVSDHPATLLVCANGANRSAATLIESGRFCVNTLAWDDEALASVFAGRSGLQGEERFALGAWDTLATGAPALVSSLVTFDCRLVEARVVATHQIIIGAVVDARIGRHGRALVYRERAYHGV